jgi:putative PEP-CTERM system TPR-repeat lipoprotein
MRSAYAHDNGSFLLPLSQTVVPALFARPRHVLLAAFAAALLAVLAACDNSESVGRLVAQAAALYDAGNFPDAIVKLKDALAQDPKNVPARILSARVYIGLGSGDAALGILLRAQQDGAHQRVLAEPRAEAEVVARRYAEAIKDTAAPPVGLAPRDEANLLAFRATALGAVGRDADARAAIVQGLALDPHSLAVRISAARLAIDRNDLEAARRQLADASRDAPGDRRLRQLAGDIAYAARDYAAAEPIYQKILDAEPWNELARGDLAAAQIAQGKMTEAIANLDAVLNDPDLADVPKDLMLSYLRAVAAFRQKDYTTAQSYAEVVAARVTAFGPAWRLAGAANYALRQYERAYYYLSPYVHQSPGDIPARKLLAATELQLNRAGDASKTLAPVRNVASDDAELLRLIALAAARSGDKAITDQYLKQAVGHEPGNVLLRTELGRAEIVNGDPKAGINDLEQAVDADPGAAAPQLPLFVGFMQTKAYAKALTVAEGVIENAPDSPTGYLLAAAVYLIQGNVEAGRAALLRAREVHRGDINANSNLAKLALADGKTDEARRYYQDIVDANPRSVRTYVSLADLDVQTGRWPQAEAVLRKGIEANPADPAIEAVLLRLQLLQGKPQEVAAAAQQALKKFPRYPALLDIRGHAQLALGQRDAALSTFQDLVAVAPDSARAHSGLAEAYLAEFTPNNPQWPAINEAAEAVKLDPHDKSAKLVLARALTVHGRFAEASKVIEALKATDPSDIAVIELDGLVARGQGRLADAATAFQKALKLNDNALDRRRLADIQLHLAGAGDAAKTLAAWLVAHPDDLAIRKMLAELDVRGGRFAEASEQYAELVKRDPKDATEQNNLAWVLLRLGRPDQALPLAKAAVASAPRSPDFLDTLGTILLHSNRPAEAVDPLRDAWNLAADRPDIGLHLSQALAATGRNDEALALLHRLLGGDKPFAARDEAQDLLRRLGG